MAQMTQMIHTWQGRRHKWNGKEILMLSKSQLFKMVTWETSVKVRLQHLWCKKHHGSWCFCRFLNIDNPWLFWGSKVGDDIRQWLDVVCIDDMKELHGKQNIDAHFRSIDIRGGRLENFSENTPSTPTAAYFDKMLTLRLGRFIFKAVTLQMQPSTNILPWKNYCPPSWCPFLWWSKFGDKRAFNTSLQCKKVELKIKVSAMASQHLNVHPISTLTDFSEIQFQMDFDHLKR